MTVQCQCGCQQWFTPKPGTKRPMFLNNAHRAQSPAGKAWAAKGGRNGRGDKKRHYTGTRSAA